jgi:hypothetical protein
MAVGDHIAAVDYNNIRSLVAGVLGKVSTGYGQDLSASSPVATTGVIYAAQWNALESDITKLFWHQLNSAPSPVLTHATNTIQIADADRAAYLQMATALCSPSTSTVGGVNYPGCYIAAPTGQNNTPISGSFPVRSQRTETWGGTTQSLTFPVITESNIPTVTHTTTLTWANASAAQYFFNSGAVVTFTASRTGGSTNLKNTSWTSLLSSMGTITFGYTGVTASAGSGSSYGWSYFNSNRGGTLTTIYSNSVGTSGSSLYAPNQYVILANLSSDGTILTFSVQFQDLSTKTTEQAYKTSPAGGSQPSNVYDVDEDVDGTLTSNLNITYASGSYVSATAYIPTPAIVVGINTPSSGQTTTNPIG